MTIDDLMALIATTGLLVGAYMLLGSRAGVVFELPWRWQARAARRRYERECARRGVEP